MNRYASLLATIVVLTSTMTGCSLFREKPNRVDVPETTAIQNQRFSTFFENDGVEVEWECKDRNYWTLGMTCNEKTLESIKVTVTVPTNGGTNFNGANARDAGMEQAKANLARFIREDVDTERTTTQIATSRENQDDTYRNPISGTGNSGTSPMAGRLPIPSIAGVQNAPEVRDNPGANGSNMNFATRSNVNDTVREIHTIIRSNSQLVVRGLQYEFRRRDDQLLEVTAIWVREVAEDIEKNIAPRFSSI